MSSKDLKWALGGVAAGGLVFLAFWLLRRQTTIPEINPAVVKWELP